MYRTLCLFIALFLATLLVPEGMALNIDISKIIDIGTKAVQATTSVPVEREVEIGHGMAASLLGAAPLLQDEKLELYVNHIGRWLAAQTERPELTWHFGILDVDTVNAFAAPGGYVFVTRGLLRSAHSESELAGVMAHEIGHVLRRHHLEAIRNEAMRGIAMDLVGEAARQQGFNATPFIQTGMKLYARGLDRDDEYEADRIGVVIATRAGYEPYGLPRVLLTLNSMNPSDANLQLLTSTHPPLRDRLMRLDQLMQGKFDSYSRQPQVTERFSEYIHGTKAATAASEQAEKIGDKNITTGEISTSTSQKAEQQQPVTASVPDQPVATKTPDTTMAVTEPPHVQSVTKEATVTSRPKALLILSIHKNEYESLGLSIEKLRNQINDKLIAAGWETVSDDGVTSMPNVKQFHVEARFVFSGFGPSSYSVSVHVRNKLPVPENGKKFTDKDMWSDGYTGQFIPGPNQEIEQLILGLIDKYLAGSHT